MRGKSDEPWAIFRQSVDKMCLKNMIIIVAHYSMNPMTSRTLPKEPEYASYPTSPEADGCSRYYGSDTEHHMASQFLHIYFHFKQSGGIKDYYTLTKYLCINMVST